MRKRLWLKIAKFVVEESGDVKEAMALLTDTERESPLKVEDVLPLFPDFAVMDDLKEVSPPTHTLLPPPLLHSRQPLSAACACSASPTCLGIPTLASRKRLARLPQISGESKAGQHGSSAP